MEGIEGLREQKKGNHITSTQSWSFVEKLKKFHKYLCIGLSNFEKNSKTYEIHRKIPILYRQKKESRCNINIS